MKDLKPRGRSIPVTNDNKQEYIDLMVKWRLRVSTSAQSSALVKGFKEVSSLLVFEYYRKVVFLPLPTIKPFAGTYREYTVATIHSVMYIYLCIPIGSVQ